MSIAKPKNIDEYTKWLRESQRIAISKREEEYYKTTSQRIRDDFERSPFWRGLTLQLKEYHDEYLIATGYPLLVERDTPPTIFVKPFNSVLQKSYRKNILDNKNWPQPPQDGWWLPDTWFTRVSDIVRTLIGVKYLDGVEFLIEHIKAYSEPQGVKCNAILEARDEGYYAAHLYIRQTFEIAKRSWDTEKIGMSVEIQITTQLQEVIRKLLHSYYESARSREKSRADMKWQWNYRSEEFTANYLGHILHYMEGIIMEVREKQRQKEQP